MASNLGNIKSVARIDLGGRKWKEKEIFVLYTGVSLLCMVFSFLIVFERF